MPTPRPRCSRLLKAVLKVVEPEERALDDPRALPLLVPVAYPARTFQVRLAGLWSVLPAASVARTLKVWDPLLRLL